MSDDGNDPRLLDYDLRAGGAITRRRRVMNLSTSSGRDDFTIRHVMAKRPMGRGNKPTHTNQIANNIRRAQGICAARLARIPCHINPRRVSEGLGCWEGSRHSEEMRAERCT